MTRFALFLIVVLAAAVAVAEEAVAPGSGWTWRDIADCIGLVSIASAFLANFVEPTGTLGQLLHFAAINGPKVQTAIRERRKPL